MSLAEPSPTCNDGETSRLAMDWNRMVANKARRFVRVVFAMAFGTCGTILLVNQAPAAAFARAPESKLSPVHLLPSISEAGSGPTIQPKSQGYELTMRWPEDGQLVVRLVDAGVDEAEARRAETAVRKHFDGLIPHGADLKLAIALDDGATRRLLALTVLSDLGDAYFVHDGSGLTLFEVGGGLARHHVRLDDRAYWTLRSLGVTGGEASDFLKNVGPGLDRSHLTLVIANRSTRFGSTISRRLAYASAGTGKHRREWLRDAGSKDGWLKLRGDDRESGLMQPLVARLSSPFGPRAHPILGYVRFHRGVDYAAAWGTPVRAAADGVISGANWRGGYGRQVRIVHPGRMTTTYSHLAEMAVAPGERVRKGQLIGRVGASGLATGPHLHFEVLRGSEAIDPMHAGNASLTDITEPGVAALLDHYRRTARS